MSCFILPTETACGNEYSGYPVLIDEFKDVHAIDKYISETFIDSPEVAKSFVENYDCSGPALLQMIEKRRYHVSYQCSQIVKHAIDKSCKFDNRTIPVAGPILCKDRCSQAVASLNEIFNKEDACPPGNTPAVALRHTLVASFQSYCTRSARVEERLGKCVKGAPFENKLCGFNTLKDANENCKLLTSDPCCTVINANFLASQGGAKNESVSEGTSQAAQTSSFTLNTMIAGIAAGGAVLLGLIIFFIVFAIKRKKNRESKSPFKVEQPFNDTQSSNSRTHLTNPSPQSSPPQNDNYPELMPMPPLPQQHKQSNNRNTQPATILTAKDNDQSKMMVVVHPYYPTLADELRLEVGASLLLLNRFDDGWGMGMNPITGQQGAFPVVCVEDPNQEGLEEQYGDQSQQTRKIQKRISSQVYNMTNSMATSAAENGINMPVASSKGLLKPNDSQFYGEYYSDNLSERSSAAVGI